jgi:hypothetical protein
MVDMDVQKELLARLRDAVISFDEEQVGVTTRQALAENLAPPVLIQDGLAPGLAQVADLYDDREYFLPELIMAADAAVFGLELLRPLLGPAPTPLTGVVIGSQPLEKIEILAWRILHNAFALAPFAFIEADDRVTVEFIQTHVPAGAQLVVLPLFLIRAEGSLENIVQAIRRTAPQAQYLVGGSPITDQPENWLTWDAEAPAVPANPIREAIGLAVALARMPLRR